jgi:hypothetical protein
MRMCLYMNKEERKQRMQELIAKNKKRQKEEEDLNFHESLENLRSNSQILLSSESEQIYDRLQDDFPFTWWGRIDWDNVEKKISVKECEIINNIQLNIEPKSNRVFILWGYGPYPVISTDIESAINNIEEINAIGHDQWIYCPLNKYVIEFYHNGEITIGWL